MIKLSEERVENDNNNVIGSQGPVTFLHQFDSQLLPVPIDANNPEHVFTVDLDGIDDVANFEQVEVTENIHDTLPLHLAATTSSNTQLEQVIPNEALNGSREGAIILITSDETGKPRCTYTDLIEQALTESGGLTVSEIYSWISDHYPFFKPDDDRWKNSVRHNLSINPYFKKGDKARSGAGHLWTISEESRALRPASLKGECNFEELAIPINNDTDRAVANILGQYHLEKNTMEGKSQPSKSRSKQLSLEINTPPPVQCIESPEKEQGFNGQEHYMDIASNENGSSEFESNNFQQPEYTIDLSHFQFSEPNGLSFDDIMPGGSLIVIQAEDQEANKENVGGVQEDRHSPDYRVTELRPDCPITETERVSGQLISEALIAHDFEIQKDKPELICAPMSGTQDQSGGPETSHTHQLNNELDNNTQEQAQYLSLDSIDHIALHEVIHGSNPTVGEQELQHYHLMAQIEGFETQRELGYCNFATEVAP